MNNTDNTTAYIILDFIDDFCKPSFFGTSSWYFWLFYDLGHWLFDLRSLARFSWHRPRSCWFFCWLHHYWYKNFLACRQNKADMLVGISFCLRAKGFSSRACINKTNILQHSVIFYQNVHFITLFIYSFIFTNEWHYCITSSYSYQYWIKSLFARNNALPI